LFVASFLLNCKHREKVCEFVQEPKSERRELDDRPISANKLERRATVQPFLCASTDANLIELGVGDAQFNRLIDVSPDEREAPLVDGEFPRRRAARPDSEDDAKAGGFRLARTQHPGSIH
jgi:hypothetical protein